MERRENVFREALEQNEKELQQWQLYIEENETAINNMNMFNKKLTVDVMVPFGKKAFFPGRIIHTNEVFVAHYQDYFSECSTFTATEICQHRIEKGKQRLKELETEKVLFKEKLEKPHLDGVLPNSDQREIIEEYDEENEKTWREQHRMRVKEAKLKEKKEREELLSKFAEHDILQTLEEDKMSLSELNDKLDELENEYANETQELLNKLISGEMNLPPPKKRIAHENKVQSSPLNIQKDNQSERNIKNKTLSSSEKIAQPSPLNIKKYYQTETNIKNESLNSTETIEKKNNLVDDGDESDSSTSEIPEEIRLIEEQAGFLPQNDRAGFYLYQLQIVEQKLVKRSFNNSKELEEKMHLFKVRDYLEELLEEDSCSESNSETNIDQQKEIVDETPNIPKRKISFSTENQMLEFRKNETVAQMLPSVISKENTPQRDIIQLDNSISTEGQDNETCETNSNDSVDKRKTILEKVEENLRNNNMEDTDLVNKIIDSSVNRINTLHIQLKHSLNSLSISDDVKSEIPRTPADLYTFFNLNKNNEIIKNAENNFYLKESDRERAYVDIRSEFLSPTINAQSKSILKNKSAVDQEQHCPEKVEKHEKQKNPIKKDQRSVYGNVMGDVMEHPTEPDPLPESKFVDMHAPKKRISRFKQMRTEKTS